MNWQYNDGGRLGAGYKGNAGDCVVRAIAIASNKPYQEIYDLLFELNRKHLVLIKGKYDVDASPRNGNLKQVYEKLILSLGFEWVPLMKIGLGCKVHLKKEELPDGIIIARCSRHLVAVINGIIQDTFDCSRNGTRCVYGYWRKP